MRNFKFSKKTLELSTAVHTLVGFEPGTVRTKDRRFNN